MYAEAAYAIPAACVYPAAVQACPVHGGIPMNSSWAEPGQVIAADFPSLLQQGSCRRINAAEGRPAKYGSEARQRQCGGWGRHGTRDHHAAPRRTPAAVKRSSLQEAQEAWMQLGQQGRVDGPEWCDSFIALIDSEKPGKQRALAWLSEHALPLALAPGSCRAVQRLLEHFGGQERDLLVSGLLPHVIELYESPNGNHVLTKAIEVIPRPALEPIIRAIERTGGLLVARHRYGCRVLERLIENGDEVHMGSLINELISHSEELARHPFGNFVIQHLLEHGTAARRGAVLQRLGPVCPYLATHRTATHVVQHALNHSHHVQQQDLADTLLQAPAPYAFAQVAASRYGSYVAEELHSLFGAGRIGKEAEARIQESLLQEHEDRTALERVARTYGLLAEEAGEEQ